VLRTASTLVCFVLLSVSALTAQETYSELQAKLFAQWQEKRLTLRDFYDGDRLLYNSQGELMSGGKTGPWTLYGIVAVQGVRVDADRVAFTVRRMAQRYNQNGRAYDVPWAGAMIELVFDPPQRPTLDSVNLALAKIFLRPDESLRNALPPHWKFLFEASQDLSAKNPMRQLCERYVKTLPMEVMLEGTRRMKRAKSTEFAYAELDNRPSIKQHLGAAAGGNVWLCVVVEEDGSVQHAGVLLPVGMGLEETAIETVRRSRFKPATIDKKPVRSALMLEARFSYE
jgi:hypothetical protein